MKNLKKLKTFDLEFDLDTHVLGQKQYHIMKANMQVMGGHQYIKIV